MSFPAQKHFLAPITLKEVGAFQPHVQGLSSPDSCPLFLLTKPGVTSHFPPTPLPCPGPIFSHTQNFCLSCAFCLECLPASQKAHSHLTEGNLQYPTHVSSLRKASLTLCCPPLGAGLPSQQTRDYPQAGNDLTHPWSPIAQHRAERKGEY